MYNIIEWSPSNLDTIGTEEIVFHVFGGKKRCPFHREGFHIIRFYEA